MTRDSGAILIYTAFALVALLGFSALVVDMGVLWVSREQAQNAADSAAHAGAVALAFDAVKDRSSSGAAVQAALAIAASSRIWGAPPSVLASDVTFPNVAGDVDCATGATPPCVRVNVYRNMARANPLPTFFGHFIGITSQNIQATATGKARAANASTCLGPWLVADRWQDNRSPTSAFNRYNSNGSLISGNRDVYTPPSQASTGTGYRLDDIGTFVTLKAGTPGNAVSPWFFYPARLPQPGGGSSSGTADYRRMINTCNDAPVAIGGTVASQTGNLKSTTRSGVNDLIALDPGASWNTSTKRVQNSCAQDANPCATFSPRIKAVLLFNPDAYALAKHSGNFSVAVVNILAFFIVGADSSGNVTGYITQGSGASTGTGVGQDSSFLRSVLIIR